MIYVQPLKKEALNLKDGEWLPLHVRIDGKHVTAFAEIEVFFESDRIELMRVNEFVTKTSDGAINTGNSTNCPLWIVECISDKIFDYNMNDFVVDFIIHDKVI